MLGAQRRQAADTPAGYGGAYGADKALCGIMDRQQIPAGLLRAATATREEGKAVSYAESVEWGKGEGGGMGDVKMVEQAGREGRGILR